ncbi:MBOAT family protein [Bacillus sp. AFS041924]|uniref:MBOAT family O-acyltransferase n=1 Tax=Bacillus sp. AFS041924 TaxID=2033503 RepID=UPI000BFCFD20|nr:MBOAT family O-acyltransferase [Bacillus sp. AFS041924]PGS48698.1 membrane-bound O-acyltransferase family protein [Bacillus sp. AFS041924]
MVFSSTVFIFWFLPIVLLIYFVIPRSIKNFWLLLASLFFYAWGEPTYVWLMIFSIIMNYLFGLAVDKNREKKAKIKWIMIAMVSSNLFILGIFKYTNFIADNIEKITGINIDIPIIPLPIGISFFTFHALSYVIDVYRGDRKVQKNPLNLALYITMFPQLVAGPIVRYQTVANELNVRKENLELIFYGIKRFIIGLAKKMLLANTFGQIADQIFAQSPDQMTTGMAWIGIVSYSLQIFFDFSGYSDMAIGLGKIFGFHFLENFNYPYISRSVSEFWRRWHISLGTWFRDYLYIPLGGNRGSNLETYRNLFIVWLATGIWHGASWTFIAWGLYYGFWIALERSGLGKLLNVLPKVIQHFYALIIVIIGWVFFRSETFSYAFDYIKTMFAFNGTGLWNSSNNLYVSEYGLLFIIAIITATPIGKMVTQKLGEWLTSKSKIASLGFQFGEAGWYCFLLLVSLSYVVASTFNPFIYFKF